MTDRQDEAATIGALLAELAEREPLPALSYDALLHGGRRRRTRRRVARTAGAALAALAATAAVAVALPDGRGTGAGPAATAPTAATTAPAPTHPATPATTAGHDPLTPTPRVLLASGTDSKGHHWQVYARMWYAAGTPDIAYQQLLAVWRDEGSVPAHKPDRSYADHQQIGEDYVQTELWIDGVHTHAQGDFFEADSPGFGLGHLTSVPSFEQGQGPVDGFPNAVCLGWNKSQSSPAVAATEAIRPDIVKVTVRWPDGTVAHPALVTVGRSPDRFLAFPCRAGQVATASGYDKHGTELLRTRVHGW